MRNLKYLSVSFKLTILFVFTLSISAIAQPGNPGGNGGGAPTPISGLEILIGSGVAIGVKKLVSKYKKSDKLS